MVVGFLVGLLAMAGTGGRVGPREGAAQELLPEWSHSTLEVTPSGNRKFLGQFGNQTVSLSLAGLPSHSTVTVSFDLYIINSWDGNDLSAGPDIWDLSVTGGPILLHTTFTGAAFDLSQAYPDNYPEGDHPAGTGAAEVGTLGYSLDSVYRLRFTFPHADSSVQFDFSGINLQEIGDESWGLDNVEVAVDGTVIYSNDFESTLCNGFVPTLVGTAGHDVLLGTEGDDVIAGLGGNDTIDGLEGDDIICGGPGHDVLSGGAGHDVLLGDEGNDTLSGGDGDDILFGGAGNDTLSGGPGIDLLFGEEGNDTLEGEAGIAVLLGGPGNDTCPGGSEAQNFAAECEVVDTSL
jgi:Ca2+-binding RTX toxin-like protein